MAISTDGVSRDPSGGVTSFEDLTDGFTLSGNASKVVSVKADGSGLEATTASPVSGYLKVLSDIMSALAGADAPHDTSYTDGEYVGLLLNKSSASTGVWVAATTSYTVPALKKCLIVEFKGADGTILDSANQKIRFYNVTDASAVLPETYYASAAQQLSGREIAGAAGKEFRLESYHGSGTVTPLGWIILRITNA